MTNEEEIRGEGGQIEVPSLSRQDLKIPEISISDLESIQPSLVKILNAISGEGTVSGQGEFIHGALSIYTDIENLALDQEIPQLQDYNFKRIIDSDLVGSIKKFIQDGIPEGDIIHQFIGEIKDKYPHDFEYIKKKYPHNLYSPETVGALLTFAILKFEEENPVIKEQDISPPYTPLEYNSKEWKSVLTRRITELAELVSLSSSDQVIIWNRLYCRMSLIKRYSGDIDEISKYLIGEIEKSRNSIARGHRRHFDKRVRIKNK
ncbi:MAG: hypothetical protein ACYDAS_01270 [Patescibacteria group bacterium]